MNWYLRALKKYAVFSGRARRKEYWYFVLFFYIIFIVLAVIDFATGLAQQMGVGILSGIFALALIIPWFAVQARRLHDTGRSGWWILIVLVPLIGGIVLLVFSVLDSEEGDNKYGPNPKLEEA